MLVFDCLPDFVVNLFYFLTAIEISVHPLRLGRINLNIVVSYTGENAFASFLLLLLRVRCRQAGADAT